jgi:DNA-binding CsgD family transcriptional regulator
MGFTSEISLPVSGGDPAHRERQRLVETYVALPPPCGGVPAALAELTDREVDVLRQLAAGRSNAEISAQLFLSGATVKTHVTRILGKLNLRDRVQAVVAAYEVGWFDRAAHKCRPRRVLQRISCARADGWRRCQCAAAWLTTTRCIV